MMPNLDGVDVVMLAPELPSLHDVICSLAGGSSSSRRWPTFNLAGPITTWTADFQPGRPNFNLNLAGRRIFLFFLNFHGKLLLHSPNLCRDRGDGLR